MPTTVLAIESSCDETAVAILRHHGNESNLPLEVLASEISSQIDIHREFGGVVPELASRNHSLNLRPLIEIALKNAGLTDYLTLLLQDLNTKGETIAIIGTGFISAILSAIMNNMPTIMIMDIALQDIPNQTLAYANIIGCNLGPKMTPFGSLATLLWLHVLAQKGVKIGFWQYSKFGLMVTPPVLLVVLLSLR